MKKEILVLILWLVYLTAEGLLVYSIIIRCHDLVHNNANIQHFISFEVFDLKITLYFIVCFLVTTIFLGLETRSLNLIYLDAFPNICHKFIAYGLSILAILVIAVITVFSYLEINMNTIEFPLIIGSQIIQLLILLIVSLIIYIDED